ncbi:MAG: c-type cytochrome [Verrucomicrobia bacterium]|nr:c-type cytochrome [Verrucomicrobiota bacterium]MDA1067331.1 c-type cytochrome [Verrucomicrobiota bacterium]
MKRLPQFLGLLLLTSVPVFASDDYVPFNSQEPGREPLSPEEAAAVMSVPEGFSVTLFAGEPDVRQPIAMQIDDRGRIWVAESYSYKEWEMKGEDRILVFEDTDNDGHFDSRKIFYDKATHLSGMAVGFGGVWICNSPNLEFIPDRDGDDIPDGPPEVVLDGFTTDANHNFFNGLDWGPDGWMYGRHGITASSLVGTPGTSNSERTDVSCGIWRMHPVTREFEIVVRGTTNPWGLDWNDMGEMFMTGNVNGHLWHVVPGAFYPRMHGQGSFSHVYDRIGLMADHLHHEGEWTDRKKFRDNAEGLTDIIGGGHSHCGAMIYLGDNWPDKYRNTIFLSNTHGRRINNDILQRKGSGYVGLHGEDFMKSNHPWYKGVTQIYGPDGSVFMSDWTDIGECHDNDGVHRTSGRIYKVSYGEVDNPGRLNLAAESNLKLVAYQLHKNDWYVRHARRILQERFVAGQDIQDARKELLRLFKEPDQTVDRQLRFVWALHSIGGVGEKRLTNLLDHKNEHLRSWAVRLIGEGGEPNEEQFNKIKNLARNGESPLVRLYVASTFPRFSETQQWDVAQDLLLDFGYKEDQNLPNMIWFALRPLVSADPVRALGLLKTCFDPLVYKNIVRRIASDFDLNAKLMPSLVTAIVSTAGSGMIDNAKAGVTGIEEALHGLKGIDAPSNWDLVAGSDNALIRKEAARLQPVFDQGSPMTANDWLDLLDNQSRRNQAIRELASFDDPKIAGILLKPYSRHLTEDRLATISTLSSRRSFAGTLVQAMKNGQVKPSEVSAFYARQIFNLGDDQLNKQLEQIWGKLRQSPKEKQTQIASWQSRLTSSVISNASIQNGKRVFEQTCSSCHSLFGEGGNLGPHLDGTNRHDLYYVLENLIDPSAVLPQDYRMTVVTLKDGRILSGNISAQSRHTITISGLDSVEVIPVSEVMKQEQLEQSTMPEGLLQTLKEQEVVDLIAYLQQ